MELRISPHDWHVSVDKPSATRRAAKPVPPHAGTGPVRVRSIPRSCRHRHSHPQRRCGALADGEIGEFTAAPSAGLLQKETADGQCVHARSIEAANGVGGAAHDRLAFDVERRVEDAGNAGATVERVDERPESRVHLTPDRLRARRAIARYAAQRRSPTPDRESPRRPSP